MFDGILTSHKNSTSMVINSFMVKYELSQLPFSKSRHLRRGQMTVGLVLKRES